MEYRSRTFYIYNLLHTRRKMGPPLGVTPPISTAPPTPREVEISGTLLQELRDRGVFEGPEEARTR